MDPGFRVPLTQWLSYIYTVMVTCCRCSHFKIIMNDLDHAIVLRQND